MFDRSLKLFVIILLFVPAVFAQTGKLVLDENVPNITGTSNKSNDISSEEWSELESALKQQDWTKTSILAEQYIQKLGAETKDLKLARLRYIYLYSLAGKVVAYSFSNDRDQEEIARARLKAASQAYIGKEFVFPVRKVLGDCEGAINFVCDSAENSGYLHISATNSEGTSILFSEYVEMRRVKLDVKKHNEADVILGGILKGVRPNPERSNKLIMTLEFEDGYVHRIYPKNYGKN
ncbi:MAG: hypothetical protein KIS76_06670 [Pyrinomonadaceae bacterium]|nr:hypothetical protein [Pyrinomonadaceae bacterium]